MKAKGFEDLIGIDISKGMLDIAQNKGTYTSLKKGDLQQTLPFEDGTFDCAVSSAVSTYLSELFIRTFKFYLSNIALKILHFFSRSHSLVKLDSSCQEWRLPLLGAQGVSVD